METLVLTKNSLKHHCFTSFFITQHWGKFKRSIKRWSKIRKKIQCLGKVKELHSLKIGSSWAKILIWVRCSKPIKTTVYNESFCHSWKFTDPSLVQQKRGTNGSKQKPGNIQPVKGNLFSRTKERFCNRGRPYITYMLFGPFLTHPPPLYTHSTPLGDPPPCVRTT